MPTARSIPRAAAFSRPSVTSRERGLMSGAPEGVPVGSPGVVLMTESLFREAEGTPRGEVSCSTRWGKWCDWSHNSPTLEARDVAGSAGAERLDHGRGDA